MGKKIAIATPLLVLTLYQVVWCSLSTLATTAQSIGRVHLAYMNSQGDGVS